MNTGLDLSQLRDIHLPAAVGWWPPAFGWWILVAAALIVTAVWVYRYHAARRHRAAAAALRAVIDSLRNGGEPVRCAQRLSITLRRFAMTLSDSPERVAGLTGEPWLAFLDSRWEWTAFTRGAGRGLLSAPYVAGGRLDREHCLELGLLCQAWVKAQPLRS